MALTVITVILYAASIYSLSPNPTHHQLKIGGLNETELLDLKLLSPTFPNNSEVEKYGAWSANFELSFINTSGINEFMALPPIDLVAPFLSRIKSWGYKITFYNSFVDEVRFSPSASQDPARAIMMPILSYTWILEKELVFEKPPIIITDPDTPPISNPDVPPMSNPDAPPIK